MKDAGNYIVPKLAKIPNCTEVTMAGKKLVFGKTIWQLEDSNHLLGDISALRRQMDSAGYLLLRGFFDPVLVGKARSEILDYMSSKMSSTEVKRLLLLRRQQRHLTIIG